MIHVQKVKGHEKVSHFVSLSRRAQTEVFLLAALGLPEKFVNEERTK